MLKLVFYVSFKTTPWPLDEPDLAAITEVAQSRNADLDVTGALVSTQRHFSQVLEGPPAGVDAIMDSIARDPRHRAMRIVEVRPAQHRLFPEWSLAYAGRATYVGAMIAPLVEGGTEPDAQRLMACIRKFASTLDAGA